MFNVDNMSNFVHLYRVSTAAAAGGCQGCICGRGRNSWSQVNRTNTREGAVIDASRPSVATVIYTSSHACLIDPMSHRSGSGTYNSTTNIVDFLLLISNKDLLICILYTLPKYHSIYYRRAAPLYTVSILHTDNEVTFDTIDFVECRNCRPR